jgi:hypothetical protein
METPGVHCRPDMSILGSVTGMEDAQKVSELRVPFPLRDGVTAWLTLPSDLTEEEAERLSAYVKSLAQ